MHFLYSSDLLNQNQFGFTPQKSTTDAAMAVKDFIDEVLTKGQIVALVSLDVKGAFDVAASYFKGNERYLLSQKLI